MTSDAGASDKPCKLISGVFSLLVQAGLVVACIVVLLIKRWREWPRRPLIVWFFDLTKQGFSSALLHATNLIFGVALASDGTASQCGWYFVLYVITSSVAIFVVFGCMQLMNWIVAKYQLKLLQTGEYGSPPAWQPWLAQLLVWGAIGLSEKVLTTCMLIVPFRGQLGALAAWLESKPSAALTRAQNPMMSLPQKDLHVIESADLVRIPPQSRCCPTHMSSLCLFWL